jgi:hypothetical protein
MIDDFDRSYCMNTLIDQAVELNYRMVVMIGEVAFIEVWTLKHPN